MPGLRTYISEIHEEYAWSKIFMYYALLFIGIITLDHFNIPSNTYYKYVDTSNFTFFVGIAIALLIICISWIFYIRFLDLFKLKIVNSIDLIFCLLLLATISYIIYLTLTPESQCYKCLAIPIVLYITMIILMFRIEICTSNSDSIYKMVDLKDLYEMNTEEFLHHYKLDSEDPNKKVIIVSEKDVNYDLLERDSTLQTLQDSIISVYSESSHAIGLQGEWGSGKTTLINKLKENLKSSHDDIVIIDNFNPWIFGSEDALLLGMLDTIMSHTGIRHTSYHNKKMINNISKVLSSMPLTGAGLFDFSQDENSYQASKNIQNKIHKLLSKSNKRYLFILDNIERANSDNIIFIFKLIGTIFNFPNVIYLLAYDRKRLINVFRDSDKVNPQYLEKIINQEINVPQSIMTLEGTIYSKCIQNLLHYYVHDDISYSNHIYIQKIISQHTKNLRQFKRYINSVIPATFKDVNNLNTAYLLGAETILFYNSDLYDYIIENKKYFTVDDINKSINYFSDGTKKFYEKLFKEYPSFEALLSYLFRKVKYYFEQMGKSYHNFEVGKEYNKPIDDERYFNLYFCHGSNDYILYLNNIEKFINSIKNEELADTQYNNFLPSFKSILQGKFISWKSIFSEYIEKNIGNIFLRNLFVLTLDIILQRRDEDINFILTERGLDVLDIILNKNTDLLEYLPLNKLTNNYSTLLELNNYLEFNKSGSPKAMREIENIYTNMCRKIIKEKINIFDSSYYAFHISFGFKKYLSEPESAKEFKEYIMDVMDNPSIYFMILDIFCKYRGFNFFLPQRSYDIISNTKEEIDKNLEYFGIGVEELKIILRKYPPSNDLQKLILNFFYHVIA